MSSEPDHNGHQGIQLPPGFRFGEVNSGLERDPFLGDPTPVPLDVLALFVGTFEGTGFNTIFRPNNGPTTTCFPTTVTPKPPLSPNGAVLELNPYKETLSFSHPLGSVPNRGFDTQGDIRLNGVTYLQSITDTLTGIGIHCETGFWLYVPASTANPNLVTTLLRMGSIPHGTTVNAQGALPETKPGNPDISSRTITPFKQGDSQQLQSQAAQTASNNDTPRIPQDLTPTPITQAWLNNPAVVLENINDQLNILETQTFSVSTTTTPVIPDIPKAPCPGGGTANIAFLGPNANAVEMDATFWVETVEAKITIESYQPGVNPKPILIQPDFTSTPGLPAPPLPTFSVTPPKPITQPTTITQTYTQIQYRQVVFLNFSTLTWPHVSVATLVPQAYIEVPASAFDG